MRPMILRLLLIASTALVAGTLHAQDLEKGKDINETCAGCHGAYGQGGKRGEYPRIGGQRAGYLEAQLRSFRDRARLNMPMFPYTQERELSDQDIKDVSAYLAGLQLPTSPPDFKDTDDAYARLLAMDKVMIVPRVEGDLNHGKGIFQEECADCHGADGRGGSKVPMLIGQYTNYLKKQMEAYLKGERPHDKKETSGILNTLKDNDLQDIMAYLTSIQEHH